MTTVSTYRSTDASAPVLTGSAGTLITVLDACLVNGYGALPAAGWTKAFSGTNLAAYRMSAVDGTGSYLNVNDAAPGAGGAREARMTGFLTMAGIASGTGSFPTLSQLSIGIGAVVCRKSATADGTARAWTIVADDTAFYLFTETGDNVSPVMPCAFVFGDIFSYKTSDAYRSIIVGRNQENTASSTVEGLSALAQAYWLPLTYPIIGHYMAGNWTGVGGAIPVGKHIDMVKMGANGGFAVTGSTGGAVLQNLAGGAFCGLGRVTTTSGAAVAMPYPNGPDGALLLSPIWVHHNGFVRGYFKGLWAPLAQTPLNHNDTYNGSNNLSGKSFLSQSILMMDTGNASVAGQVHIETSSTWS